MNNGVIFEENRRIKLHNFIMEVLKEFQERILFENITSIRYLF